MKYLSAMFFAAVVVMFLGAGCVNNEIPVEDTQPVPEAVDDPGYFDETGLGGVPGGGFDVAGGPGVGEWEEGANNPGADEDGWVPADPTGNRLNMPVIYFAYDSDLLVPSETAKLDAIVAYLNDKPALALVIEGHCDQRGTEEYNRALGERRANAIRAYLAGKGLADGRMKTVSYGEDKPAVEGEGESVWAQNRRGVPVPMRMPQAN